MPGSKEQDVGLFDRDSLPFKGPLLKRVSDFWAEGFLLLLRQYGHESSEGMFEFHVRVVGIIRVAELCGHVLDAL